jgi:hypothetical protein
MRERAVAFTYHEEQLLRSLAGRAAISDLTARLNRAQDTGDANAWLSGFLPEGQLMEPGRDPVQGHANLLAYFRSLPPGRIHISADSLIDVAGVNGRHEARYVVLGPRGDGADLVVEAIGRHRDEFVYERGEWYVVKRELIPNEIGGA